MRLASAFAVANKVRQYVCIFVYMHKYYVYVLTLFLTALIIKLLSNNLFGVRFNSNNSGFPLIFIPCSARKSYKKRNLSVKFTTSMETYHWTKPRLSRSPSLSVKLFVDS